MSFNINNRKFHQDQNKQLHPLWVILAIVGFLLICINMWGYFTPLRAPTLMSDFPEEISITEAQFKAIANQEIINRKNYLRQATVAVQQSIVHYWDVDTYSLRVPVYENYLLFIASYLYPPLFEKYEYNNYQKAVERGIGLCSQHAIILTQVLDEQDIPAKIVGLDGHVVVTALADPQNDQWWILDPDFGVIIDQDLAYIEQNPTIISHFYAETDFSEAEISNMVSIFEKPGNFIPEKDGSIVYHPTRYVMISFEYLAYVLKWLLPLVFIFPFFKTALYPKLVCLSTNAKC